jgi:hypothetical protein
MCKESNMACFNPLKSKREREREIERERERGKEGCNGRH